MFLNLNIQTYFLIIALNRFPNLTYFSLKKSGCRETIIRTKHAFKYWIEWEIDYIVFAYCKHCQRKMSMSLPLFFTHPAYSSPPLINLKSYTQLYPPHPTPTPSLFQSPLLLHTWDYFRDLELVPHHWPLTHFMPWILSRRQTFGLLKFSWVREKASGIKWVKRNQDLIIVRSSDRRCSVKRVFWKILQIL